MEVSAFDHFLGGIMERHPGLMQRLGNLETRWYREQVDAQKIRAPIYISGLARSGSTLLLELVNAHPEVVSHRYRDFPLVHLPVWWSWFLDLAGSSDKQLIERAHKDGIMVNPDSPEAMEEVLWMSFFDTLHDTRVDNLLTADDRDAAFDDFYRDHIRKLLFLRGGQRYLAKGNYNISRIEYLCSLFPDAKMIIPVRDPVWHIASLLKQHKLFQEAESSDMRVKDYMRRVGHFEFGLDLRPLNFGDGEASARIGELMQKGELEGWVRYWDAVYGYLVTLLEKKPELAKNLKIIDYNSLCESPAEILQGMYAFCELQVQENVLEQQAAGIRKPGYYQPEFSSGERAMIERLTTGTIKALTEYA